MYANSHWRSCLGAFCAVVTGGDFKLVGRKEVFDLCEFALALALLAMQIALKHNVAEVGFSKIQLVLLTRQQPIRGWVPLDNPSGLDSRLCPRQASHFCM